MAKFLSDQGLVISFNPFSHKNGFELKFVFAIFGANAKYAASREKRKAAIQSWTNLHRFCLSAFRKCYCDRRTCSCQFRKNPPRPARARALLGGDYALRSRLNAADFQQSRSRTRLISFRAATIAAFIGNYKLAAVKRAKLFLFVFLVSFPEAAPPVCCSFVWSTSGRSRAPRAASSAPVCAKLSESACPAWSRQI